MRKERLRVLILALLFVFLLPAGAMLASEGEEIPLFRSIAVDKQEVTGGDQVKVSVEVSDVTNQLESMLVVYKYESTDDANGFELIYNPDSQKYEGTFEVNAGSLGLNGRWLAYQVYLYDKSGNMSVVNRESGLSAADLYVSGNDITPPVFESIEVDKKIVTHGDTVNISVEASDNESGISSAVVHYRNNFQYDQFVELQFDETSGKYRGTFSIGEEIPDGHWLISQIEIHDYNGNVQYLYNSETDSWSPNAIDLSHADITVFEKSSIEVTGVEANGFYHTDVTPVFNGGAATLNGENFVSGTSISEEGVFTLIVTDELGKIAPVTFTIDKTAPIVNGVFQGETYDTEVIPEFKEGTATLNGLPYESGAVISDVGQYTLVVIDQAGNKTAVEFSIDKTATFKPKGLSKNGVKPNGRPFTDETFTVPAASKVTKKSNVE